MRSIYRMSLATAAFVGTISIQSLAEAKQYKKHVNGREVIVHTNPIPVILHRMVPPQHGRHITQREIETNNVPPPGRPVSLRGK